MWKVCVCIDRGTVCIVYGVCVHCMQSHTQVYLAMTLYMDMLVHMWSLMVIQFVHATYNEAY